MANKNQNKINKNLMRAEKLGITYLRNKFVELDDEKLYMHSQNTCSDVHVDLMCTDLSASAGAYQKL